MQAIAQKVLGNVLGKYIEGLEKNNIDVGLLSGTFKIENVALKKEISDMFNLPFNFKFNNVGKINAKIPWKSLSTSPVEIELEDIMVIAEPKSKEDLQLIALNIFKDRQKTLEDFASILEEKLKKKGKEEGPGYFAGLVTKIIDNVQVSIKNIHIRFECNLGQGQRYNFGITMDSLSIFTVDQNDKRVFLDRSKPENAKLPVHKKLNLSDFSLYWNEKELNPYYEPKFKREGTKMVEIPVTKEEKSKVINRLRETIPSGMGPVNPQAKKVEKLNDFVYLLNLSIDAKMVQYTKTQELINKGIPEISLQFELDRLNSMLTKGQFGQIMGLMDYFSDYLAMAEKEVKKLRYKYLRPLKSITRSKLDPAHLKKANIKSWWRFAGRSIVMQNRENKGIYTLVGMNKPQKLEYSESFKALFSKIDFNNSKQVHECLTKDEFDVYQTIVLSMSETALKKAIEEMLKEKTRNAKKESKRGWFSGSKVITLSAEEEKEIDDLLKEVVFQEENKFQVPDNFSWLKVRFAQKECNISLQRVNPQKQIENVDLMFANFEVMLGMRKNGMDVELFLENFQISRRTEISKGNVIREGIFRPLIETHKENKLVNLKFSTNPTQYIKKGVDKDESLDMLVDLSFKRSEIIYNNKMVATLIDVFDTSNGTAQMENLRKAASEQAELLNQQGRQKLHDILKTQKTAILNIQIAAPLIVLPYDENELYTSECLVLSPGILKITGDNYNRDESALSKDLQHYDSFRIGLENIQIEYIPSMLHYMKKYTPERVASGKQELISNLVKKLDTLVLEGKVSSHPTFELLKNFNIILDLNMLRPAFAQVMHDEPKFKVSANISKLVVDLDSKIYSDLMKVGDIFQVNYSGATQVQTDKKGLQASCSKFGNLVRGSSITGFTKKKETAMLSGGRIYFFESWTDKAAYDYFSLRKCRVKLLSLQEANHPYGLAVISEIGAQQWLGFEDESSRQSWESEISKVILFLREKEKEKERQKQAEAALNAPAIEDSGNDSQKTGQQIKKAEASKEANVEDMWKHSYLAHVKLQMDELQVRVFSPKEQMFEFSIALLTVAVDQKEGITDVEVTLRRISVLNTSETDDNLKTLISSETNTSIAHKIQGLGITTEDISKDLVSIKVKIIDKTNSEYKQLDTDVSIMFGSLFVALVPRSINKLMKFFIPQNPELQKQALTASTTSHASGNYQQQVTTRAKQLIKPEADTITQLKVVFKLKKISLLMINEIKNIYLSHASISDIEIDFRSKMTGMHLEGKLNNVQLHDLTNYPNTLTKCSLEDIRASELFGLSSIGGGSSLISLEFKKYNADFTELPEQNVAGNLNVTVAQVKISFFMQVIMRILDYITGQVLPSLNTEETAQSAEGSNTKANAGQVTLEPLPETKEVDLAVLKYNLQNPFWMKMDVNIQQPTIILKCRPDSPEFLQVELGNISIRNHREQNAERIKFNHCYHEYNKQGLPGDTLVGIWTETYTILMQQMSIKKMIEQPDGSLKYQYFMHPFNFNLALEMAQYADEYKHLLKGSQDSLGNFYTEFTLAEDDRMFQTTPVPTENTTLNLIYEGGMAIRARISPMIMIFGNAEFNFIMKTLNFNISYDDMQDIHFSRQARQSVQPVPAIDQHKGEAIVPLEQPKKDNSMTISIDIDYISMVAMDTDAFTQAIDNKGENEVFETRLVYGKLFIKELRVLVLMKSDGTMEIGTYIRSLVGSYLHPKEVGGSVLNSYDKSFIGKLGVCGQFDAQNPHQLRRLVVQDLQESISERGNQNSCGLSEYSKQNLMLKVKIVMEPEFKKISVILNQMRILAQTDVLLKLSGMTTAAADTAPDVSEEVKKAKEETYKRQRELIKTMFANRFPSEHSGSRSAITDDGMKQKETMQIVVLVQKVMFVVPTKEHQETLVTSGDVNVELSMYEQYDKSVIWELQQGYQKLKKSVDAIESRNRSMMMKISLEAFQIFHCEFGSLLKNPWKLVSKRHLLMPLNFNFVMNDFQPVAMVNNKLENYSYRMLNVNGESLVFKVTLSDLDVLTRISDYQMQLLSSGKPAEEVQAIENQKGQPTKTDPLTAASNQAVAVPDKLDPNLPVSRMVIDPVEFGGIQVFIINDDQKIFVPVLDFCISGVSAIVRLGKETEVLMMMYLGVDYYNPSVSKWEPFVESTKLKFTMNQNGDNGIQTNSMALSLMEQSTLNMNLSVKAVAVVMNSLNSYNKWNMTKVANQAKQGLIKDFLHEIADIQEIEDYSKVAVDTKQGVEAMFEKEIGAVDYVSPYMIVNMTGYPISFEQYINTFVEEESLQPQKTKKEGRMVTKRIGSECMLENDSSMNLKIEAAPKMKKANNNAKLNLEEQETGTKLKVKINHPEFNIKSAYDLSLDHRYTKRKFLEGNKRLLSEFSAIYHSVFDDRKKTFTVSSPVLIENLTQYGLELKIHKKVNSELDLALKPSETKPVPLDLVASNYQFSFKGRLTEIDNFQKLTNKEDGYFKSIKLADDKYIIARIKRDPEIHMRIVVVLLPVMNLKNCLPYALDLNVEQAGTEKIEKTLMPQESIQLYGLDPDKAIAIRSRVQGTRLSDPVTLVDKQKDCEIEGIQMRDADNSISTIKIVRISDHQNQFTYHFYAAAILLNETPLDIEAQYCKGDIGSGDGKLVAGLKPIGDGPFNSKIVLLNNIDYNLKLRLSQAYLEQHYPGFKNSKSSELVPLKALDSLSYNCQIENDQGEKMVFEFGIYLTPLFVDNKENIYTKVVQVSPRNIFFNSTNQVLELRQADTTTSIQINPGGRSPYWWSDAKKDKKLQVRTLGGEWSSKFNAKAIGSVPLALKTAEQGTIANFVYEVKIDAAVEFTYFKEMAANDPYFAIKNESAHFEVVAFQKNNENLFNKNLKTNEETPFAWINPDSERTVVLRFRALGYEDQIQEVDLNKISVTTYVKLASTDKKSYKRLSLVVSLRRTTKFLRIFDATEAEGVHFDGVPDHEVSKHDMSFTLDLAGLGISIIGPYERNTIEALYIYFRGIEFMYKASDFDTKLHFKMKYMNIDNNTTPLSPFQVLLTPSLQNMQKNPDYYFINFLIEKRNDSKPEIQLYDTLAFEIQPVTICLDDIALGVLLKVVDALNKVLETKPSVRYQHKYFHISNESSEVALSKATVFQYAEPKSEWEIKQPELAQSWIYAKEFKIANLSITISFKSRAQKEVNSLFQSNIILKSLGVAVANIDEGNLSIKGYKVMQVFETSTSLVSNLILHFKGPMIFQGIKLLGSIDILGNPVNLFSNIGTGVVEFFDKPLKGFAKGPLDGAKGIGLGAGSLVKHTAKGILNSASKATGAASGAFSALSMDDEFIKKRERLRQEKSKNVIVGVGKGLKSVGVGLYAGVTGIVTQPLRGARQEGFLGFVKGLAKGIVGVVVKPLTGVLDFASHTTEGLKNTVTYFDDKANEAKIRTPRAFYGQVKYFKKYDPVEALVQNNLKILDEGKYAFDNFLQSFLVKPDSSSGANYFIITVEHIFYYVEKRGNLDFVIEPINVTDVVIEKGGFKIIINQNSTLREQKVTDTNEENIKEMVAALKEVQHLTLANQLGL